MLENGGLQSEVMQAVAVLFIDVPLKGYWEKTTVSPKCSENEIAESFDPTITVNRGFEYCCTLMA
jgi:hypothetical protein